MKNKWACLLAIFMALPHPVAQYRAALPGYHYQFPHDFFNHPDFQTEWWYYTGNLKSPDGHRFGFELTFFRQAADRDSAKNIAWDAHDLYLAHLALSDLDGQRFYHAERMNRAGPGIAGINEANHRIWNGNWQIDFDGDEGDEQRLQAINENFSLHLTLRSEKPPVIHGQNGVSQKAEGAGRASHYISLTRLNASGGIQLAGKNVDVAGTAWMDHEFFSNQLASDQVGWDWLSLQLNDRTELMLYRIRRKDGSVDPYSAGTYIDPQGRATHLQSREFTLEPLNENWTSPLTHATYPIRWKILLPKMSVELEARTPLPSQELSGRNKHVPRYWEGAITLAGRKGSSPIAGVGYLEMTGYERPFEIAAAPK
jgi:predicted secreted hydrolase